MSGLRLRIAGAAVAAAATVSLAVLVLVGPPLRERATADATARLLAEARLIARVVAAPMARGDGMASLDPLVDAAARDVRARVTVIALDGRVMADSSLSGADLLAVENHAGRPEVQEALARGTGLSRRHSATVDVDLLYAAVAVVDGGRTVGVSRVAESVGGIEAQVGALRRAVGVALGLAFLLAVVLSAILAAPLAGPLGEMMGAARRLAAGDLSARIPVRRGDELGELAQALNQAAQRQEERVQEAARDRARIAAILSAMEDGVLAVDHAGIVVLANDSLRRLRGGMEPVGRHYLESLRQREVAAVIDGVLARGERQVAEDVVLPPTGRAYALTGVPFPGAEGDPRGAVLTLHDVTDRHHIDHIRRDFVANASHELRTPLTSIRGFVEALEDGALADPETAPRFLEKIRRHAERMSALVDDLLELSRLESGETAAEREDVVLGDVAEEVVSSFAELAARKDLSLRVDDRGPALVASDGERLRRILSNLVENAVKYTPEGGHVTVALAPRPGEGAEIVVEDDGPGIAAVHLPRLFERFYRADKARSRELGGTGLGLAIVRHLAESLGARIAVESAPGRGTRFTLTLPGRD